MAAKEREEIKGTTEQKMARRHIKEGGNQLEQKSNKQRTMEGTGGGLHPAVDGQSQGEDEGEVVVAAVAAAVVVVAATTATTAAAAIVVVIVVMMMMMMIMMILMRMMMMRIPRKANAQTIHIRHTYRISLKSSPLHHQLSRTFGLLRATLQQNNCTRSSFPITQ